MTEEKSEKMKRLEAFAGATVFFIALLMVMTEFLSLSPVVVVAYWIYWGFYARKYLGVRQ